VSKTRVRSLPSYHRGQVTPVRCAVIRLPIEPHQAELLEPLDVGPRQRAHILLAAGVRVDGGGGDRTMTEPSPNSRTVLLLAWTAVATAR
jgi:hypothetical protein